VIKKFDLDLSQQLSLPLDGQRNPYNLSMSFISRQTCLSIQAFGATLIESSSFTMDTLWKIRDHVPPTAWDLGF